MSSQVFLTSFKSSLGNLARYSSNLIDSPTIVLLYHRVTDVDIDPQQLTVKPDNFHAQVEYLKYSYNILSIEEFQNSLKNKKKLPKRSLILTFDDGYADNYYEALPVLERHNVQALFYISTSLIDTQREFWWDDLERIFLLKRKLPMHLIVNIKEQKYILDTSNFESILETYQKLHSFIKPLELDDREQLLSELYQWAGVDSKGRESHRIMTKDEIVKLSQSKNVVIGAHTHNHVQLSSLSYQEQFNEIQKSKLFLEDLINRPITHFSYPYGAREDYNAQSVEIVKKLGFDMVSANFYWQVHKWTNRYQIPRMLVRDWDLEYFKQEIKKSFHY